MVRIISVVAISMRVAVASCRMRFVCLILWLIVEICQSFRLVLWLPVDSIRTLRCHVTMAFYNLLNLVLYSPIHYVCKLVVFLCFCCCVVV